MTSLFRDLNETEDFNFDSEDVEQEDFWTETREKSLRRSVDQGFSTADIAKFMHVPSSTIREKREELGISSETITKKRNCLVCDRKFESEGAHNRQCNNCRGKNHWPFG